MRHTITLTLGHSPDADDLVMWWPLTGMAHADGTAFAGAAGRPALDTGRWRFRTLGLDIHELNSRAAGTGDLDITAISAFTYPFVRERYRVTRCGGSFGEGYGPKVVVRQDSRLRCEGCLRSQRPRVGVPGDRTTAFLALSLLIGAPFEHVVMPFQEIAPAVAEGRADAGLLIHEAQLTYADAGLREIVDLGAWWKERTDLPLPLGLNVVRRDLDGRFGAGATGEVADLLRASVRHARSAPGACRRFLLDRVGERPEWADEALVGRYLGMYVNDLTEDMGKRGGRSLERLYSEAAAAGMAPAVGEIDLA